MNLREIFDKYRQRFYDYVGDGVLALEFDDFEQAIADYEKSKWVSVDERLPEMDEWVLFCYYGNPVPMIGCYKGKGFVLTLDEKELWQIKEDGVKFWMSLPTTPKP